MCRPQVYHTFAARERTWEADVDEYLTEDHVRIAHEAGLAITLYMVKDRALADPANQRQIGNYCEKYPNIKLILAHAARGFNPFHTIEGIESLRGLRNVWCDSSAVTEAGAFEAIVEVLVMTACCGDRISPSATCAGDAWRLATRFSGCMKTLLTGTRWRRTPKSSHCWWATNCSGPQARCAPLETERLAGGGHLLTTMLAVCWN